MTMRIKKLMIMMVAAIMAIAVTTSCHKDKHDEPTPGNPATSEIDRQLLGKWQSKLILGEKTSLMVLDFKEDATMTLSEQLVLSEEQKYDIEASGNWKAVNGTLTVVLKEANMPELVGKAYIGKYEILVGQLYFQNLFAFPFDKVTE